MTVDPNVMERIRVGIELVTEKLLDAFREQAAAKRQLANLQEQASALVAQMQKREGYIAANLERYADEKGTPFQDAVNADSELAARFRATQGA